MIPASSAAWGSVRSFGATPKYVVGGGVDAVGAVPEVDGVEVQLEDQLLGVVLLDRDGERGLLDLAAQRLLRAQQRRLDVLLGDRRAALGALAGPDVDVRGTGDGLGIDTVVHPEPLVLDCDHRVLGQGRDLVERDRRRGSRAGAS